MKEETTTYYGALSQLHSGLEEGRLRTTTVEGLFYDPPEEGSRFCFYGEPLTEEKDVRVVLTTPVTLLETGGDDETGLRHWLFSTRSGSRYELTLGARPTVPV